MIPRWRSLLLLYSQRYVALGSVGEALQDKTGGRNKSQRKNWRPFEKAREHVRTLGLETQKEWQQWVKIDAKPKDIPASPRKVYPEEWQGWRDWLGTGGRVHKARWRPFEAAREYVRALGFKTYKDCGVAEV